MSRAIDEQNLGQLARGLRMLGDGLWLLLIAKDEYSVQVAFEFMAEFQTTLVRLQEDIDVPPVVYDKTMN
jgi:uncharacterized protein with PIN domain